MDIQPKIVRDLLEQYPEQTRVALDRLLVDETLTEVSFPDGQGGTITIQRVQPR